MKVKSKIFYLYGILLAVYTALTLIPTPPHSTLAKYHLSPNNMRALDISFILLAAVIWFAAFYGYDKLHAYSGRIKKNKDGLQVNRLSYGLLFLAIGSPLSSILSSMDELIAQHHPAFTNASVIMQNYVSVLFPLVAFICISVGARGLSGLTKTRPPLRWLNFVALIVIILGVVFCYLIAHAHQDIRHAYHMSYGLVMLTLAIPYMYIWFLGMFAVAELQAYSHKLVGVLYKKGWNLFAFGLASIILLSIVIQYLSTLSSWLNGLSLSWVLLLLYVLLILLGVAYILVALGAKKLMRIEEA